LKANAFFILKFWNWEIEKFGLFEKCFLIHDYSLYESCIEPGKFPNFQIPKFQNTFQDICTLNNHPMYRIGSGIDFHKLAEGRKLWIGGVNIPHTKGAVGHSDADVLLHAICDALLGALCLGDIGVHFPDTDEAYKNIASKILLQKTYGLVKEKGYTVVNVDSTLCLQSPKIRPYVAQMQKTIAAILGISETDISVKATTTEQLGFVGREEGVVAYATVLLEKR
jgi:2-C-methyl-D-erythritol 2,4-cyclodiphosphate synthase